MKKIQIAAYAVVLLLLIVNLYMSFQMLNEMEQIQQIAYKPKKSLPCESVPVSWAVKHYDCANSLLLAMNVTNVKFESPGSTNELLYDRTKQISTS